jgi:hypothetical protein
METHCAPIIQLSIRLFFFNIYINFQHEKMDRVLKANYVICDIASSESYRAVRSSLFKVENNSHQLHEIYVYHFVLQ